MKDNVFIHVGLPKTGTSFLQSAVFPNITDLKYSDANPFAHYIDANKVNLISDESLSMFLLSMRGDKNLAKYRYVVTDRVHKCFPNAKIIIGMRDVDSWLKSTYSSYVRHNNFESYNSFLESCELESYVDFLGYKEYLVDLFNDVFCFEFDDFKKDVDAVVCKICRFMDVPVPLYRKDVVNPRMTDMEMLRKKYHGLIIGASRKLFDIKLDEYGRRKT